MRIFETIANFSYNKFTQNNSIPRMTLETANYLLRPITQQDSIKVYEGLSHPKVIAFYGVSYSALQDTQNQMDWYANLEKTNTGRWRAICSHDNKTFFGAIGYNNWNHQHRNAEIGFWLLPDHWKKGIMKEVVPVFLNFGFTELNIHRIEAIVEPENTNSTKLLLANGFQFEGTKRECEFKNGKFIDLSIYAKLKPALE